MKRFVFVSLTALMALLSVSSCKKEKVVALEQFSVYPLNLDMAVKETRQLYAILLPENATNQEVLWSSDNPNIASVSETGLVKASAINDGRAVITARCGDKEARCIVNVTVPVQMFDFISGLHSKSMVVGEVFEWNVYVNPLYATERENIVFENSDSSVAELKQDGSDPTKFTVTAKKLGSTVIKARCGGKEAELLVCVETVKATKVTITPASVSLDCGATKQLTATVEPSTATNSLLWYSMKPEIATVENGLVRAHRPGTVTIAVYCGDVYAYCDVTVGALPDGLVDLGLSVLWADCNLGASVPGVAGNYYAWGELSPKSTYSWNNYKFYVSGNSRQNIQLSRYNDSDGKTSLSDYGYADDAARQELGGEWRVPSMEEFNELITKCSMELVTEKGRVKGVKCTSRLIGYTDRSIFLPVSGYMVDGASENPLWGMYWTSVGKYSGTDDYFAVAFHIYTETPTGRPEATIEAGYFPRCSGMNIRPVW